MDFTEETNIGFLLTEKTIVRSEPFTNKEVLMDALITRICEAHHIEDLEFLQSKIREREKGISTTLDTGLSLPHARIDGLNDFAAALALLPYGLNEKKESSSSIIRLMFIFLSPNKKEFYSRHLQILRKAALLFQPDFIDTLNLASAEEALRLIRSKKIS